MTYTPTAEDTRHSREGGDPPREQETSHAIRMQVRKRNGSFEKAEVSKIVRAVERSSGGLDEVDPLRIATRTISGLYDVTRTTGDLQVAFDKTR